ncbi:DUF2397 family protein [Paenarthrobacter nitroguajacolicus]
MPDSRRAANASARTRVRKCRTSLVRCSHDREINRSATAPDTGRVALRRQGGCDDKLGDHAPLHEWNDWILVRPVRGRSDRASGRTGTRHRRDTVDLRLSYLVEHGNLARSPRETEARSVRDYPSNRARYQLTQRVEVVHRQVDELRARRPSRRRPRRGDRGAPPATESNRSSTPPAGGWRWR